MKIDLALNNLQMLICDKAQPTLNNAEFDMLLNKETKPYIFLVIAYDPV